MGLFFFGFFVISIFRFIFILFFKREFGLFVLVFGKVSGFLNVELGSILRVIVFIFGRGVITIFFLWGCDFIFIMVGGE